MGSSSPRSAPLVSVVIPNYNHHGQFLPRVVESVLGQTLEDFELFVLDNASTDDSRDVVRRYARKGRRVRLLTRDTTIPAADNFREAAATEQADT